METRVIITTMKLNRDRDSKQVFSWLSSRTIFGMNELSKIIRVIKKIDENYPTEIVLVLDGNIGQNSVKQAEVFKEICNIDSIIITKLDGTAKGGVLIPIAQLLNLPISFIGTGEQKEDLINFRAKEYTEALLDLS